jgi:hypothetical protein
VGFEPTTPGLKVRSSTAELRALEPQISYLFGRHAANRRAYRRLIRRLRVLLEALQMGFEPTTPGWVIRSSWCCHCRAATWAPARES